MLQRIGSAWSLLGAAALLYGTAWLVSPELPLRALETFSGITLGVLPVLAMVFGLMFLSNLFLKARDIAGYVGKGSGLRGWSIAIGGGILSSGPIYMWYPLLADLRGMGMKGSLVAAFLYSRAVKIPLIPLMLFYFGVPFTLLLNGLLIIFSAINGILIGRMTGGD